MADYYERLGVTRDADISEIKKAYRSLAMNYHPDRNDSPDAEEKFRDVTEAYEVLRDPEQRSMYDRFGEAGVKRGAGGAAGGFGGFDFGDAFEVFMREFGGMSGLGDLFGRGRTSSGPRRGGDLKMRMTVSLEEAARGVKRSVRVKVLDPCDACDGSGAAAGTRAERCATCGGAGQVRQVDPVVTSNLELTTVQPVEEQTNTLRAHASNQTR